jgi:hypothetical protein
MSTPPTSEFASIDQRDQTKPLTLTAGKVTPKILRDFEDGCETYFFHKKVKDDEQVQAIVLGIKDHRISDWYRAGKAVIVAMTFSAFMAAVHIKLLKDGWEYTLQKEILSSTQGTTPFDDWQNNIGSSNSLLVGTTYHVPEATIRAHLTANMNDELASDCDEEKTHDVAAYGAWIDAVVILDLRRARSNKKHKHLVEDAIKAEHAKSKYLTGPSAHGNKSNNPNPPTPPTAPFISIPKLTQADCELLNAHEGCYKCHGFYAGHKGSDCQIGFPDPASYKPLTEAGAQAAKKKKSIVAAIATAPNKTIVAAVGMSSSVIGDGTDSGEYVPILHAPHLFWDCLANDPNDIPPFPIHALIDDGCTTVLIMSVTSLT